VRRIFGPKRKWQEAGEDCKESSFITCMYASLNTIRVMRYRSMMWVGQHAQMGDEKCIQYFAWKTHGRYRYRWKGNIRIDLKEIGLEEVDWVCLAQDRDQWQALVNMVTNLHVP
jgi:hypothetical protein